MDTGDIIILVTICVATLIDIVLKSYYSTKASDLATKEDIQEISFESEKGKNLATKEDIQEITRLAQSIKSDVSFESQRKHDFIEKRTELFLSILNNAEEIYRCHYLLTLYIQDYYAEEKIYSLIQKVNDDLRVISFNSRLLLASYPNQKELSPLNELTNILILFGGEISAHASNAISAMSKIKKYLKLYLDSDKELKYWKEAMAWDEVLTKSQNEIFDKFKYVNDFTEKRTNYIIFLNKLYNSDFHLKYEYNSPS